MSRFGPLGTILGTPLLATVHAGGIQSAAYNVVAYAGEILDTTATNQNDGVFLKVVAFTRNVAVHLLGVGETYPGHFTHR